MPVYSYKTKNIGTKYKYMFDYNNSTYTKSGFSTSREAKNAEKIRYTEVKNYGTADMIFEVAHEHYINNYKNQIKIGQRKAVSLVTTSKIFDFHILPYFKGKKIISITPLDVKDFQSYLLGKNYSLSYVNSIHKNLSAFLNYCTEFFTLPTNPARIAKNVGKTEKNEPQFWTVDEFFNFISFVPEKNSRRSEFEFFTAMYLLFYSGVRIGELMALKWSDFNQSDGSISISKTKYRVNKRIVVEPPKTKASIRIVFLPSFVTDLLVNYRRKIATNLDSDFIFNVSRSNIDRKFYMFTEKSKNKRIRIHDLRHSHASHLISLGVDIYKVSKRLGHVDIKTTINTYAHLYPESDKDTARLLE